MTAHPLNQSADELSVQLQLTLYSPLLRYRQFIRSTLDSLLADCQCVFPMDVMRVITAFVSFRVVSHGHIQSSQESPRVWEFMYPISQSTEIRSALELLEHQSREDKRLARLREQQKLAEEKQKLYGVCLRIIQSISLRVFN